jgi:hypothetical protein
MTFYLAGKFRWRLVIRQIATKLRAHGHTINGRWLTGHDWPMSPAAQARYAAEDFEDIDTADAVVVFQFPVDEPEPSTGRHVELGYALGMGKPVILVGLPTSVFHYANGVTRFSSLESFYDVHASNGSEINHVAF